MADKIEITTDELYRHAKAQIDGIDAVQGLEIQTDALLYTLQNLSTDIEASGVTLSQATKDGLAALTLFADKSSVAAADITAGAASAKLMTQVGLKGAIRNLQAAYYAAKARLGLT